MVSMLPEVQAAAMMLRERGISPCLLAPSWIRCLTRSMLPELHAASRGVAPVASGQLMEAWRVSIRYAASGRFPRLQAHVRGVSDVGSCGRMGASMDIPVRIVSSMDEAGEGYPALLFCGRV